VDPVLKVQAQAPAPGFKRNFWPLRNFWPVIDSQLFYLSE